MKCITCGMETTQTSWMKAKDAAAYLGRKGKFSYQWITRLAKAKKIRAGHDGKAFLFKPEDLDAWLYVNANKVAR